jgi:selenocysteine lyase/cysteine desulfurase
MIAGLLAIPGLKLYGITDAKRFDHRCATIAVRIEGHTPLELATKLGDRGIFYRIQAGPLADPQEGERICTLLRQRNVGCILVRP